MIIPLHEEEHEGVVTGVIEVEDKGNGSSVTREIQYDHSST